MSILTTHRFNYMRTSYCFPHTSIFHTVARGISKAKSKIVLLLVKNYSGAPSVHRMKFKLLSKMFKTMPFPAQQPPALTSNCMSWTYWKTCSFSTMPRFLAFSSQLKCSSHDNILFHDYLLFFLQSSAQVLLPWGQLPLYPTAPCSHVPCLVIWNFAYVLEIFTCLFPPLLELSWLEVQCFLLTGTLMSILIPGRGCTQKTYFNKWQPSSLRDW